MFIVYLFNKGLKTQRNLQIITSKSFRNLQVKARRNILINKQSVIFNILSQLIDCHIIY